MAKPRYMHQLGETYVASWRTAGGLSIINFLTGLFGYVTSNGLFNLTLINGFRPPVRLAFLFASLFASICNFIVFY